MSELPSRLIAYPLKYVVKNGECYYYLDDIGKLLCLENPRMTIRKYDDSEILSAKKRSRLGIVTYYNYKGTYRRDNTAVLLTKFGLIKIISSTKSIQVKEFKDYFNQLIIFAANDSVPGVDVTNGFTDIDPDVLAANHLGAAEDSREAAASLMEYVYVVVESPYNNRAKIGKTTDIKKRVQSLQTGNPNLLQLYDAKTFLQSDNMEGFLHAKYADRRIYHHGSGPTEWFHFSQHELSSILN